MAKSACAGSAILSFCQFGRNLTRLSLCCVVSVFAKLAHILSACASAFSTGHNGHDHPSSVSANLAEIRRAGKYPDLHQLDLLQVRQGESQRQ
jgi:hypothetical protein